MSLSRLLNSRIARARQDSCVISGRSFRASHCRLSDFPLLGRNPIVGRPPRSIRMSVSACWNVVSDRPTPESADAEWNKVGQGLKLVGAGYVLMIGGACLGLFLAWPAISGKGLSGARVLSPSEEQATLLAGLIAVGVAALCSFLLIVA